MLSDFSNEAVFAGAPPDHTHSQPLQTPEPRGAFPIHLFR